MSVGVTATVPVRESVQPMVVTPPLYVPENEFFPAASVPSL